MSVSLVLIRGVRSHTARKLIASAGVSRRKIVILFFALCTCTPARRRTKRKTTELRLTLANQQLEVLWSQSPHIRIMQHSNPENTTSNVDSGHHVAILGQIFIDTCGKGSIISINAYVIESRQHLLNEKAVAKDLLAFWHGLFIKLAISNFSFRPSRFNFWHCAKSFSLNLSHIIWALSHRAISFWLRDLGQVVLL